MTEHHASVVDLEDERARRSQVRAQPVTRERRVGERRRTRTSAVMPAAWIYIGVVCGLGAGVIASAIPGLRTTNPLLLAVLMLLSLLASVAKVEIPVPASDATLTVCHVIDYTTLLLFGPDAAVLVAAWGAWTQCTFRSRKRNLAHQTFFSIACLAITMRTAGTVYLWFGGHSGVSPGPPFEPFVAAATVVFLVNSMLVAGAVALSNGESPLRIWTESFLSSWPSYLIGAGLATAIAVSIERKQYWILPLLTAPLVLIHRNFKLYAERVQDAITDPLTGLPNQRFMTAHVARELARSERTHEGFALVVLDLDGFKSINDGGGHAAGDAALWHVAQCLKRSIRANDFCARYGGDEFLILLGQCSLADAERRTREIQTAVSSVPLEPNPTGRHSLTISAGIALYPDDGRTFEALFEAADARMYDSKFRERLRTS